MNDSTYIGIDPGKKGGICIISKNNIECIKMPINSIGEMDNKKIFSIFEKYRYYGGFTSIFCLIEKAQSMPKQGAVGTFNYGKGYGALLAILDILMIPFEQIRPQKWKKEYSLIGATKKESVALAEKLCPKIKFRTIRDALIDGMAEAFLIAEYARRKNL